MTQEQYALKFPWYASQHRIETRMYINHCRVDDVWIGKALYRYIEASQQNSLQDINCIDCFKFIEILIH